MVDFAEPRSYRYTRPEPPLPSPADIERFWSYVRRGAPDDCWPWRTLKRGTFWWRDSSGEKQHQISPRVAYRVSHGGIDIPPGAVIAHSCDWRACCNPAHLKEETQQQNSAEISERGLHPYMKSGRYRYTRTGWWRHGANGPGDSNGFAKLTDEVIETIRERYVAGGVRQIDLAAEFGIGQSHVSRIIRREAWGHLETPGHTP